MSLFGRDEEGCKMDVNSVDQHQPDIKEQDGRCQLAIKEKDGQCRPRKVQWLTSTTLFMTNCIVKNVAK